LIRGYSKLRDAGPAKLVEKLNIPIDALVPPQIQLSNARSDARHDWQRHEPVFVISEKPPAPNCTLIKGSATQPPETFQRLLRVRSGSLWKCDDAALKARD
jgi:hypothetical protein